MIFAPNALSMDANSRPMPTSHLAADREAVSVRHLVRQKLGW